MTLNSKIMEQNQANEIDVRRLVRIVLEHWWWFVISVAVCMLLGLGYYLRKAPKWTTDAAIMLRQKDNLGSQIEAFSMMGLTGNAAAEDEVVVLSSRGLLSQAIDALNIWDASAKRGGLRWEGEFRDPALKIEYLSLTEKAEIRPFSVVVKRTKSGYKVKTKMGYIRRSTRRVADLSQPVETGVGTLFIHATRPLSSDSTYRVVHMPRELVVAGYRKHISIVQNKKESNVIRLSTTSAVPERDKALLYQIIEQYNQNAIVDKNLIASNTAAFIEDRLALITQELSEAEEAVADYMEQNKIANIQTQSELFLKASSAEQRQLAEIETQLSLVEYVDEFMHDDTKRNNLIPSNIGITDGSLSSSLG